MNLKTICFQFLFLSTLTFVTYIPHEPQFAILVSSQTNLDIKYSPVKMFGQFLKHVTTKSWKFAAFQNAFEKAKCFTHKSEY